MARYHLKQDGTLGLCKAEVRDCPLGDAAHHGDFETQEQAQTWAEDVLAVQHPEALSGHEKMQASASMHAQLGLPDLNAKGFARPRKVYAKIAKRLTALVEENVLTEEAKGNILASMDVAWQLHKDQVRKGTKTPYIVHPLESMDRLLNYNVTRPSALQAMALHDCVEDCSEVYCAEIKMQVKDKEQAQEYTQASVHASFGPETGYLVEALSTQIAADKGSTHDEQNRLYQEDVDARTKNSFGALIVTFSDFMDNAGTLKQAKFDDGERKKQLAHKYLPLVKVLKENAQAQAASGILELTPESYQHLDFELTRVENDLRDILA